MHPRAALTVLGAFFVALGAAVAMVGVLPADAAVREALLGWATPAMIDLMRIVNRGGDWRLLLPGTLLLLAVFRRARERWWLWIALMIAAPAAEGLLKIAIGRARPESLAFGFPSGHATAAAAFFGAVLYLAGSLPPLSRRVVRVLAVACIVLVGLARIVLRAHWPSDVLGGITLGLGLATVAALLNSLDGETDRRLAEPGAGSVSK
ncbi:MAG TPA: phosphatase PAP2 family protein [Candidatus Acidoferrum sp.]|nr:phosphatase PAP2 family protein [Candidatus Acidoferrum sp.]